jgi:flagellar protein FlbT
MSNLVLELRQGEVMIVNGAPIRFRTKSRIELTAHARFLFGKQIMPPDQADSPARRIYFALQSAYIGNEDERRDGLAAARDLVNSFKAATTSSLACEILDRALAAAEADDCYQALKLIRRVIRHEDTVLGRASDPAPVRSAPERPTPRRPGTNTLTLPQGGAPHAGGLQSGPAQGGESSAQGAATAPGHSGTVQDISRTIG